MIKLGVSGANGKIGKILVKKIVRSDKCDLSSVYVRNKLDYDIPSSVLVTSDIHNMINVSDVIIDFSSRNATRNLLEESIKNPKPLVIGTTGLSDEDISIMREVSRKVPVLYATNMSIGMSIVNKIVAKVAKQLPKFDVEIFEVHHKSKQDAPSGTALTLAREVADAKGLDESNYVFGRSGVHPRSKNDISILSSRGGDITGRHTISFYGKGEYIEITHNATDRDIFALGAFESSLVISDKQPGLYSMGDIFHLD